MIVKVFSVFDAKMATFDQPFYMLNEAAAIRAFSDAVNDTSGQGPYAKVARHPEDYSLFSIGVFDDVLGTIVCDKPVSLVTAASLVDVKSGLKVV